MKRSIHHRFCMTPIFFVAGLAWLLFAVPSARAQDDGHDHDHDHDAEAPVAEDEHGDDHGLEISLSAEEQAEFGIVVAEAGPGVISTTIKLPGTIHPNDDRLAHLVPRYDGIVTAVHVQVGDQVSKGQALATVESDQSLAPYELRTLIDGTVISKHITLGEAASRDRAPFVVADLSTVWLDLHVYQRDLDRIQVGQRILGDGDEAESTLGEISYISPVVDEATRTALARVVLDNASGRWRPGMFVTVEVETNRSSVPVAVPASALFILHDAPVLFVSDEHGFSARHVETGHSDGRTVEILSGLEAGEPFVTEGGFTLKAELEKSTFGDGHNH